MGHNLQIKQALREWNVRSVRSQEALSENVDERTQLTLMKTESNLPLPVVFQRLVHFARGFMLLSVFFRPKRSIPSCTFLEGLLARAPCRLLSDQVISYTLFGMSR